jgi:hypothetical protein
MFVIFSLVRKKNLKLNYFFPGIKKTQLISNTRFVRTGCSQKFENWHIENQLFSKF